MKISDRKVIMFAGKGGVGKTTCASATALQCANCGERVLIVSTDPTPSLIDIFNIEMTKKLTVVSDNLFVLEVSEDEIKEMWDRKFGEEVYEVFSSFVDIEYDVFVDFITSILPGLGEEFMVDYIRELAISNAYDRIIWDTAPLGQTLGLLKVPEMLYEHLRMAPRIYSHLKLGGMSKRPILDIIGGWCSLSEDNIEFLKHDVDIIIVTIPEALAVEQMERVFAEFKHFGLNISKIFINNCIEEVDSKFMRTKREQQVVHIATIKERYAHLGIYEIPLFPVEVRGIDRLNDVRATLFGEANS